MYVLVSPISSQCFVLLITFVSIRIITFSSFSSSFRLYLVIQSVSYSHQLNSLRLLLLLLQKMMMMSTGDDTNSRILFEG
uniref:Secreted protein n=1 Tax=Caenorhabditis tropicalis TaxID=1561998 RepID=A0A1I7T2B1_9PELO